MPSEPSESAHILEVAERELAVVHYALRKGDTWDATGRLADIVSEILRVLRKEAA